MKKRKGLTLIEIMLAMLVLGMITVVFLTIFNNGNRNIASSGDKTQDLYDIQKQVDDEIKKYNNTENQEILVTIPGIITNKKIEGKFIIKGQDEMKITTFVRNKVEGE